MRPLVIVALVAGCGRADQASTTVMAATLFPMASVTKPFVATAVIQLVEQDKFRLDQPVTTYLPYFRIKDPRATGMTVRQLLTHTAGMPDVTDYHWGSPESDNGALERWVRTLADSALISAPGEQWQYSNIGFEVLADLIAKVSGVPFEDYIQRQILTPLGMRKSTLQHDMTAALAARFKQGGVPMPFDSVAMGLSWFLPWRAGQRLVFHSGGDNGFRTDVLLAPDHQTAVVVMTNGDRTDLSVLAGSLLATAVR